MTVASFLWIVLFHVGTRKVGDFPCHCVPLCSLKHNHDMEDTSMSSDPLDQTMRQMGFTDSTRLSIQEKLRDVGLSDPSELVTLAADFKERPEVFSLLLQTDFGLDPISAHRTRAAVMNFIFNEESANGKMLLEKHIGASSAQPTRNGVQKQDVDADEQDDDAEDVKRPLFKSLIVNEKAKKRRNRASDSPEEKYDYGLSRNYQDLYPILTLELADFEAFMTRPSISSQEAPIRPATADVYMKHAHLFLGWFLSQRGKDLFLDKSTVSLFDIVASKEKESADCFIEFIMWLRTSRSISVSYEANVLRGLTKLLKFRFASQSKADPSYGEKPFDDIPIIRELRKLHREADKRQRLSPRSSDEDQKWLSWTEYLKAIQGLKNDLLQMLDEFETEAPTKKASGNKAFTPPERKIATLYQQYLVLAFFSCVPDRQRTIRELELKRSFVRDKQNDVWIIKHGPDDYKTGKTYGDRPPLVLSPELVPAIDDFLERWRPCLMPKTNHLFIQPRTGNPLTQNSVYQIVARACYKYSGKRTNPHLLRDMIVTHVRESDASEKQLEALALYMGHSIQMQRTSYDRRTLTKKVAPAVELLQSVNKVESKEQ